jgi:pimeloyl-ACP methyl ester carboxylesterase
VAALRLALHSPGRVTALCLVGAAGLGAQVSLALRQLTLPAVGEAAVGWGQTPLGAAQRALLRVPLLFANPARVPPGWLAEQYRLGMLPGFLATTLAALRGQVGPAGQRHVLIDDLPRLTVPTLLLWGDRDRVVPVAHARAAVQRVPHADLAILPATGHLPQVEQPDWFVASVLAFLSAGGPD